MAMLAVFFRGESYSFITINNNDSFQFSVYIYRGIDVCIPMIFYGMVKELAPTDIINLRLYYTYFD